MKLFVIGDSISQGFMSLAAARTDLSYPSVIARLMGLENNDWRIPTWPRGGLPLNIELLLRQIEGLAGPTVELLEWPSVLNRIRLTMDNVEDYYEREEGGASKPDPSGNEFFHNIAVRGFNVADAWLVDGNLCHEQIRGETRRFFEDGLFELPNASFYRTALNVLNPSRDDGLNSMTALDWLERHHTGGNGGVENLLLWLGANNALGTVVSLEIIATNSRNSEDYDPEMSQPERRKFNLWSPDHFKEDYRKLLDKVDRIMVKGGQDDWMVFIGTVPAVTIAPLAKGVGDAMHREDPFGVLKEARYYKYYTYFPYEEEDVSQSKAPKLTREHAYTIDSYIACYNRIIKDLVESKNKEHKPVTRYHVVDINKAFLEAAYKRNDEMPVYQFPDEMRKSFPMVDSRFYHADKQGRMTQGGLVSLDGVHPSAIGQGLIAHEFLKVINNVRDTNFKVDWDNVYENDDLYMKPIRMMPYVRRHAKLFHQLLKFIRCLA